MRLRLALTALLLLASCQDEVRLHSTRCTEPCYTGREGSVGVGVCRSGTPVCEGEEVIGCEGETLPSYELCDGLDNDCNGRIDESAQGIGVWCDSDIYPFIVGASSQCVQGRQACVLGVLQCVGVVGPTVEVCDGVDNDCNGEVDEGLAALAVCYDGSLQDLTHPNAECRAGVLSCVSGVPVCVGEVLPVRETCDRKDNDCDGLVDNVETSTTPQPVDIVLMVDRSGSMGGKIEVLKIAVLAFMAVHDSDLYHYAVVDVPGPRTSSAALSLDFTTARNATLTITLLDASYGGVEPSYDAAVQCVDGTFPLSWRKGAVRIVVFFGDENGQTLLGLWEQMVALTLFDAGATFYAFIDPLHTADYDDIANLTGGRLFNINTPAAGLINFIADIFLTGCTP